MGNDSEGEMTASYAEVTSNRAIGATYIGQQHNFTTTTITYIQQQLRLSFLFVNKHQTLPNKNRFLGIYYSLPRCVEFSRHV
jgi:hypothetical protein